MALGDSYFWKQTPFLKILLATIAGILLQWYCRPGPGLWWVMLTSCLSGLILVFFIPLFSRYRYGFISGIFGSLLFLSIGALLTRQQDIRNDKNWIGHSYRPQDGLLVTLNEPPVEKTRSVKAEANIDFLLQNGKQLPVKGKLILYFKKDSALRLNYGSQILFRKPLQEIKNAGNPGGFDYKRYTLFHGITHQVYLKPGEFEMPEGRKEDRFRKFIYASREKVLHILRENIPGEKELGLAEALLIGYKGDLEQSLVQSYTNTGVVHIIAISGLHLGLIYWLLAWLLRPLQKRKKTKWLRPLLIITGLWLFSLLAGAQPSILRSAIMFTCIVLGESLTRKTSIYNSMAVSAFILLCINPYWLWDVGFQLSYAAVLSIIIFLQPVYQWFYIENKLLDFIWKLNAVTIAAQILTLPLSIYHFHQFPVLFLLANFLVVPLSSIVLLGEIFLCVISFLPVVSNLLGRVLSELIRVMNVYIERIEAFDFSLWDGLQINLLQALFLLGVIAGTSYWLLERSVKGLKWGLLALLAFTAFRSLSFIQCSRQQKIIVYNVPQKRAVDIIGGRQHFFTGDSDLLTSGFARNFHLKPSRVLQRMTRTATPNELFFRDRYISWRNRKIVSIDESVSFAPAERKPVIDLLILSKNPRVSIPNLATAMDIRQVVADGSVPAWKARYWKKDCDSLQIAWHDVTTNGAFVMNLR